MTYEFRTMTATADSEHHWFASDALAHVASLECPCGPRDTGLTVDTRKRIISHNSTPEESSARTVREMNAWIRAGYGTD